MSQHISPSQFHAAMGEAIANWAEVERSLGDVFTRLVVCSITGCGMKISQEALLVPQMIFNSSTNMRSRLELIGRIIEMIVSDPTILNEWAHIYSKATKLYTKRNIIAHAPIWGNETLGITDIGWTPLQGKNHKMLSFKELGDVGVSFKQFAHRVSDFAVNVNRHLAARCPS